MRKREVKLKVLFIVSIMPPHQGGAAVDYGLILKCLAEGCYGHFKELRVLTERGCSKDISNLKFDDRLLNYDSAEEKKFARQALNYLIILWYILFTRKDIIHIHARYVYAKYIGRIIWLALLLSPAKVVIDIRDRLYNNFGFGHNFIFCSEELQGFYSWIDNGIHIPVPLSLKPLPDAPLPGPKIAYFGTIARNKGVLELIEGYREYLKGDSVPLELHFYGFNAMGEAFLNAIEGVRSIRYLGSIPSAEIISKILEYRAVILPSKSEGMPRVCLETLYAGRILACYEGIREIIPAIPKEFTLTDTVPDEFRRVFSRIESSNGAAASNYNFVQHAPEEVSKRLLELYRLIA